MTTKEIYEKLLYFKEGSTQQSWKKDILFPFDNEYITLIRVDTSNKSGGSSVNLGKQWSLIIELKRPFCGLETWRSLEKYMGNDIDVTPVNKGGNKGKWGIRFYRMSKDPTREILESFFNYIFS